MLRTILPCSLATLLVLAGPAHAETVTLRSGRTLQVSAVRVRGRALDVTLVVPGGTARVDVPFERLDPADLLRLLDRHGTRDDGPARLRTARLALEFGLRVEAARRFRQAAMLDPGLAPARDTGLATVHALAAADAVAELEACLRDDDLQGALAVAARLREGPHHDALTPGQVDRVGVLAALARTLLQRRAAAALPAAIPAAGPAPPAEDDARATVRALAEKALHARERAADPALRATQALRHLETAARALLDGRRALRDLPPALQQDAVPGEATLRALLVATYLDLAEIHRQAARFEDARAHLRAASILDPGNEAVWSLRLLVEEDLRRLPLDVFDAPGPAFFDAFLVPAAFCLPWGGRGATPYPGFLRRHPTARWGSVRARWPGKRGLRGASRARHAVGTRRKR